MRESVCACMWVYWCTFLRVQAEQGVECLPLALSAFCLETTSFFPSQRLVVETRLACQWALGVLQSWDYWVSMCVLSIWTQVLRLAEQTLNQVNCLLSPMVFCKNDILSYLTVSGLSYDIFLYVCHCVFLMPAPHYPPLLLLPAPACPLSHPLIVVLWLHRTYFYYVLVLPERKHGVVPLLPPVTLCSCLSSL